jgi:hypothetical protein
MAGKRSRGGKPQKNPISGSNPGSSGAGGNQPGPNPGSSGAAGNQPGPADLRGMIL